MFPFSISQGTCRIPWFVFSLLLDVLLLPRLCTLRAAPPPPAPPPPAQSAQSTEASRIKLGMPPDIRGPASNQKLSAGKEAKLKANFEEMKSDVATLAQVANSLKNDLSKANPDELPPGLAEKLEQIDKLAKRIKKVGGNL